MFVIRERLYAHPVLRSCVLIVVLFLVSVMDTNMEIGEGTRFEVLLAVLLRFKVANMY
jgi:hypothetical protein